MVCARLRPQTTAPTLRLKDLARGPEGNTDDRIGTLFGSTDEVTFSGGWELLMGQSEGEITPHGELVVPLCEVDKSLLRSPELPALDARRNAADALRR